MPKAYAAAVHIGLVHVHIQLAHAVERLRRKRFVELDQVNVADVHPGLGQRLADGGNGPRPHYGRLHAGHAARMPAQFGPQVQLGRLFGRHNHHRRRAVVDAGCVARRYAAVGLEHRTQRCEPLKRGVGARPFVLRNHDGIATALRHADLNYLFTEVPVLDGGHCALVAHQRQFVLVFAANLKALCHILGGYAHVVAVDRAAKPLDQPVAHRGVAHSQAVEARPVVQHIGRLAHILGTAGHRDVHFAGAHKLRRHIDGFQAGRTLTVHRDGGRLLGNARLQRGEPCGIARFRRLQRIAQHNLFHLIRTNARALQRRLDSFRAQIRRRNILERAPEPAHRRARAANDYRILHRISPECLGCMSVSLVKRRICALDANRWSHCIDCTTLVMEAAGSTLRNAHMRGVSFWFNCACANPIIITLRL